VTIRIDRAIFPVLGQQRRRAFGGVAAFAGTIYKQAVPAFQQAGDRQGASKASRNIDQPYADRRFRASLGEKPKACE